MPKGVYITRTNTGHGVTWPDPVVRTVTAMLEDGCTYTQIVPVLLAKHNFVCTKNAIVGKANRLGLRSKNRMHNAARIAETKERRKQDRRLSPKPAKKVVEKQALLREDNNGIVRSPVDTGYRRKHKPEDIAKARVGYIPDIVETKPATSKPFCDLGRGECRWPTTDDCTHACGCPATIGSYCDQHAVLAYRTMPTRRRNASITKEQDIDKLHRARLDAEANATIEHFLSSSKGVPLITGNVAVDAFIAEHVIDD